MKDLVIIGAGGHGKVVADIAKLQGYEKILFLDDDDTIGSCMGFPVVGNIYEASKYPDSDYFVAIGNPEIREKVLERLVADHIHVATLIHRSSVVAGNVEIGLGTAVMAGAVINPYSKIGKGCIINTGATVDHDNILEDYAHVSIGSHLAGTVHVGKGAWIGAGAVVSNDVNICGGCTIGTGAVVVRDIDEVGTYIGVPARRVVHKADNKAPQCQRGGYCLSNARYSRRFTGNGRAA